MPDRTSLGVNVGPDARLPWPLGPWFGRIQQRSSFKSVTPPFKIVLGSEADGWLTEESYSVPKGKVFYGWSHRRADGRWDTVRIGHRWDVNWGDAQVQGHNPDPHIIGGYFPDVIIKRGQKAPHISHEGAASPEAIAAFARPRRVWWADVAKIVARIAGATS